ncbi:hypothetical protein [Parasphingorhabdus litoris]|uniref:hypothetical protein n=1 Tax=Parasphingorhabdus litoris TaxID=394733 RepID=UPI001E56BDC2|nr:hypothetical protein [Parasphingorhabdus litoris]
MTGLFRNLALFLAVVSACSLNISPVYACSVVRGYKVPTNLELAKTADVIVIAKVVGKKVGENQFDGSVIARPYALLKGSALPKEIEIPGAWLETDLDQRAKRSDPRELREPNPDAMIGGCVRYIFAKGMKLVLFLKDTNQGSFELYRSPFSRDAEDVSGENSLWVKAIKEYIVIGELPKREQKKRIRARIKELELQTDDPDALAVAGDMAIELSGKRLPPYD